MFTGEDLSLHWLACIVCDVKVLIGFAIDFVCSELALLNAITQTGLGSE